MPYDATPDIFLARLARLPVRDWLAVRDAVNGGELGRDLFPAYRAALEAAIRHRADAGGARGGGRR